jgi:uncharacterized protein YcbX
MIVTALWRYPVKSLQGEQVLTAEIDADGLRGDRIFGIRDESTGKVLTGRREPRLLNAAATTGPGDEPIVMLPTGETLVGLGPTTDDALSAWLGKSVRLVRSIDAPAGRAEFFEDATDDDSTAVEWTMPAGRFVDAEPLLVLTTASLRAAAHLYPAGQWDPRRFRPNILVDVAGDQWVEDEWCGHAVAIGAVTVTPTMACVRCTMVTRPQPALSRDLDIYKTIAAQHGGTLGVWCKVGSTGTISIGDAVEVGSD